jgi:hypothetical protein
VQVLVVEDAVGLLHRVVLQHHVEAFGAGEEETADVGRLAVVERLVGGHRHVAVEDIQHHGPVGLGLRAGDLGDDRPQALEIGGDLAGAPLAGIAEQQEVVGLDARPHIPLPREGGRWKGQGGHEQGYEGGT